MQNFQNKIRFILKREKVINNILINKNISEINIDKIKNNNPIPLYNFFEDSDNSSEEEQETDSELDEEEDPEIIVKECENIINFDIKENIIKLEQQNEILDDWEIIYIEN
jgi:hypothetical protein